MEIPKVGSEETRKRREAELETREDDREEVVRKRLTEYDRVTGAVLPYYRNRDYSKIDGDRQADHVTRDIIEQLETRLVRVGGRRR